MFYVSGDADLRLCDSGRRFSRRRGGVPALGDRQLDGAPSGGRPRRKRDLRHTGAGRLQPALRHRLEVPNEALSQPLLLLSDERRPLQLAQRQGTRRLQRSQRNGLRERQSQRLRPVGSAR